MSHIIKVKSSSVLGECSTKLSDSCEEESSSVYGGSSTEVSDNSEGKPRCVFEEWLAEQIDKSEVEGSWVDEECSTEMSDKSEVDVNEQDYFPFPNLKADQLALEQIIRQCEKSISDSYEFLKKVDILEKTEYASILTKQISVKGLVHASKIGTPIDESILNSMRGEQIAQLYELMKAATLKE